MKMKTEIVSEVELANLLDLSERATRSLAERGIVVRASGRRGCSKNGKACIATSSI